MKNFISNAVWAICVVGVIFTLYTFITAFLQWD